MMDAQKGTLRAGFFSIGYGTGEMLCAKRLECLQGLQQKGI